METEQEKSKFQKIPTAKLIPAASIFSSSSNRSTEFFRFNDRISDILGKILSNCYRQLDNLVDSESHFLLNFRNNFSDQPISGLLQTLKNNGIVLSNFPDERYNDAPFFYWAAFMPVYAKNATDGIMKDASLGHGFGKEAEEVLSKAIGEVLERYFLTLYHKKDLIQASVNDLRKRRVSTIDLKLLPSFSKEQKSQFPNRRYNDDSVFYWEKIKRLSTEDTIYCPAQLVYWNYKLEIEEPFLLEANTNGAGGFFTKEGAILSGLYELIQRDSFLIYWLNSLTPKRVNPKSVLDDNFQKLLGESERYGFDIHCLNITSDTRVPAFAVIISDPSGHGPSFSLGAGCQADPIKALYRAFEEAWAVYYSVRPRPPFPFLDKNYKPFFCKYWTG